MGSRQILTEGQVLPDTKSGGSGLCHHRSASKRYSKDRMTAPGIKAEIESIEKQSQINSGI